MAELWTVIGCGEAPGVQGIMEGGAGAPQTTRLRPQCSPQEVACAPPVTKRYVL